MPHMEEMMKNLSSTMELLAVATHSDTVVQWDAETLRRAFHWALYCEHIFKRFHNSPVIWRIVERQLENTNKSLDAVFPQYSALTTCDLSRCQHLLLDGLLHNRHVPMSLLKILFDRSIHLNTQEGYQDVKGVGSSIVECKSASKVLGNLNTTSAIAPEAEVQAKLLLDKLDSLLKQPTGSHYANQFLDSILQGCEDAWEDFCVIVAAALQTNSNSQLNLILTWLALKPNLLEFMCHSLPLLLLTDLAKKHLRFQDMYCDVLKKWAKEMEYDINNGEWSQVSRNQTVSFQKLTEHFVSLFKASVSLRDRVETEVKTLKCVDGDFDVRGLSVWGDLLSDIYKKCDCHS